jgi:hypothetical protein
METSPFENERRSDPTLTDEQGTSSSFAFGFRKAK